MRAIPVIMGLMLPSVAIAQSVGPLADHVDVLGSFWLEESDSVLTVSVFVTPDPVGGFIVADPRDAQVRLYDERGRLRKLVAKPGLGPGEVRVPLSGLRRPDGRLLVVDVGTSNILEFDASGDAELARYATPFQIVRLLNAGEDVIAVGTPPSSRSGPPPFLLHTWTDGAVSESFFRAPATRASPRTVIEYAFPSATVAGDRILATYTLSDTLYVYSRNREPVRKVSLGLRHWSQPESDPPGPPGSPVRRQWEEGLTRLSGAFLVGDRILVQYYGRQGGEFVWGLACLTRDGAVLFDILDTPRLLAVDGDRLYFVDAESLTEERWVIASLR